MLSLVIQAGTIIKFKDSNCGMEVYKITNGTSANPIIFTSYKDDSYCGDSNGDGAASTPSKGDWGRLTMRGEPTWLTLLDIVNFIWRRRWKR